MQSLVEPLVVSLGWRSERPGPSQFVDEQQWQGTRDPAAYLAVPAAIAFEAEHDWESVRRGCHALLQRAAAGIRNLTGQAPLWTSDRWYGQLASFPLPPCDPETLSRRLRDEYRVEVPAFTWNGRPLLRVSVQGYNTEPDIEALITALRSALPRAQRTT